MEENFQAVLKYESPSGATTSKCLHGRYLYDGCNLLDVQCLSHVIDFEKSPETKCSILGDHQRTLLVFVRQLRYPVTVDVLDQIFGTYGKVEKIEILPFKNNFQALIRFQYSASAVAAKRLDGRYIWNGCNLLDIQYFSEKMLIVESPIRGGLLEEVMGGLSEEPTARNESTTILESNANEAQVFELLTESTESEMDKGAIDNINSEKIDKLLEIEDKNPVVVDTATQQIFDTFSIQKSAKVNAVEWTSRILHNIYKRSVVINNHSSMVIKNKYVENTNNEEVQKNFARNISQTVVGNENYSHEGNISPSYFYRKSVSVAHLFDPGGDFCIVKWLLSVLSRLEGAFVNDLQFVNELEHTYTCSMLGEIFTWVYANIRQENQYCLIGAVGSIHMTFSGIILRTCIDQILMIPVANLNELNLEGLYLSGFCWLAALGSYIMWLEYVKRNAFWNLVVTVIISGATYLTRLSEIVYLGDIQFNLIEPISHKNLKFSGIKMSGHIHHISTDLYGLLVTYFLEKIELEGLFNCTSFAVRSLWKRYFRITHVMKLKSLSLSGNGSIDYEILLNQIVNMSFMQRHSLSFGGGTLASPMLFSNHSLDVDVSAGGLGNVNTVCNICLILVPSSKKSKGYMRMDCTFKCDGLRLNIEQFDYSFDRSFKNTVVKIALSYITKIDAIIANFLDVDICSYGLVHSALVAMTGCFSISVWDANGDSAVEGTFLYQRKLEPCFLLSAIMIMARLLVHYYYSKHGEYKWKHEKLHGRICSMILGDEDLSKAGEMS